MANLGFPLLPEEDPIIDLAKERKMAESSETAAATKKQLTQQLVTKLVRILGYASMALSPGQSTWYTLTLADKIIEFFDVCQKQAHIQNNTRKAYNDAALFIIDKALSHGFLCKGYPKEQDEVRV